MDEIPEILEEGKKNLRPIRPFAQLAIADLQQIRPKLMRVQSEVGPMLHGGSGEAASEAAFKLVTEKAIAALDSYQSWLQQGLGMIPTTAALARPHSHIFLHP